MTSHVLAGVRAAAARSAGSSDGPSWVWVAAALVAGVVAGALLSAWWHRRGRPAATAPPAPPPPSPPPSLSPAGPASTAAPIVPAVRMVAGGDRKPLLDAIIETRDVVPSDALRARLDRTLVAAGVVVLEPRTGARFDPRHHRAVGTLDTRRDGENGLVAELVRPGYLDGDMLLRPADVEVFRWTPR